VVTLKITFIVYGILLKNLVGMWDNISERAEMVYGKPSEVTRLTKPFGWLVYGS
jgi:hypothetical protein